MKLSVCLVMLLSICATSMAQLSNPKTELYKSKIESYTKMKKNGATMGIIGGGLTLVGVALTASADWETETDDFGNSQTTTNDPSGIAGIISLSVGIPLAVTGIILNSIGNKKVKEYSEKLENVNLGYYNTGQQKGVTIAIKF